MNKERAAILLIWAILSLAPIRLLAQEDQPLFTIVYLKSGDVLSGQVTIANDSTLVMEEWRLGSVTLQQKDINRIQPVLRNTKVTMTLGDNTRYSGRLLRIEGEVFILDTELAGEIAISRQEIRDIELATVKEEVIFNPNATRYFFAPSAIPVEQRHGYYQNAYLLSNSVNFGITENFTLGGGVVIPILFYVTPKLGYQVRENLYLGAGLIAASTFIPDAAVRGGIPYGLVTYGTDETNVTIGSGYGMLWDDNGDFQHTHYPITTVNGMVRLSNRVQLVTENWIIPTKYDKDGREVTELYMALSAGLRVMISPNSTVDFAPVYLYGVENAPLIPYLDFVYRF